MMHGPRSARPRAVFNCHPIREGVGFTLPFTAPGSCVIISIRIVVPAGTLTACNCSNNQSMMAAAVVVVMAASTGDGDDDDND